jgi:DNA repair protein RadC
VTPDRLRHVRTLRIVAERRSTYYSSGPLSTSGAVVGTVRPFFDELDREVFGLVLLDGKNEPLGFHVVSVGTLNASLVHPREVLKPLILANAAACVLVHNHPSGVATPSAEDFAITERLCRVAADLGVRVLDHVVIGAVTHYSFADEGTLPVL